MPLFVDMKSGIHCNIFGKGVNTTMPTYDYVCDNCGHEFEYFQSMSDERLTVCPECNEKTVRRLIGSGAGIIFKGSGFYETDYKRKTGSGSSSTDATEKKTKKKKTKSAKKGGGKEAA
jgi:putative FmdB family regulatory protein